MGYKVLLKYRRTLLLLARQPGPGIDELATVPGVLPVAAVGDANVNFEVEMGAAAVPFVSLAGDGVARFDALTRLD